MISWELGYLYLLSIFNADTQCPTPHHKLTRCMAGCLVYRLNSMPFCIPGVVGAVGSGKSALLLSMIGDLRQTGGVVHRRWGQNAKDDTGADQRGSNLGRVENNNGGVGYVGQEAWLLRGIPTACRL